MAKREAFESLDWAWTGKSLHLLANDFVMTIFEDQLLPSGRPNASPFTPEECQELRTLVKSLSFKDGA